MDYIATPCPTGQQKYQYTQFCEGLKEYIQANDLTEVITHEPGHELYVDWAGDKVEILDQASGEVAFKGLFTI